MIQECRYLSTHLGSSSVERDMAVLVGSEFHVREQSAAVARDASGMLGCSNRGITSGNKLKVIVPLHACQATPGVLCSFLVPAVQKREDRLEGVQRSATKMSKGLGTCRVRKG